MKKIFLIVSVLLLAINSSNGSVVINNTQDTIMSHALNEVIISSSTKETNDIKTMPGSVSILTPNLIEGRKIVNVKDLSTVVPNFFIPDYGSKLSVPIYIRGIGERTTGQSAGMYVDNAPYLNKSLYDFDFMNISQIEVLRGPQGTLYGRNAMSGIINIKTYSPLHSQFKKVSLTAGNYGLFRAKASISELLTEDLGLLVSGYYDGNDGYFKNQYTNSRADKLRSAGANLRLDWKINNNWLAELKANYDYAEQGAFPYGVYNNGNISKPNYDYSGEYYRNVAGSSFNLQYENDNVLFNSNTGFQYFDDNMNMDIDNSIRDMFRLNQLQDEQSWTQEFTIKSNNDNNYKWSFGVFGFHNNLNTNVNTTMGSAMVNTIQSGFTNMYENSAGINPNRRPPLLTILDSEIPIPSQFKTPSYGGAIFHQSTYNNLLVEGLSITAGIRLDYEKTELEYDTKTAMNMNVKKDLQIGNMPPMVVESDSTLSVALQGKNKMSFTEVLPKIALKYEFDEKHYVYATLSNGYKTGGHNIQSFADIARDALEAKSNRGTEPTHDEIIDMISFKPEYSWNYEIGFKGEVIKDILFAEVAGYYIDVKDIQITDFVESGQGRILKNAGKAKSLGIDLSLSVFATKELSFTANYGFTKATFKDYYATEKNENGENIKIDYSGNYIPFAPQNTLSLSAVYNKIYKNKFIDRLNAQIQYNGVGKIYWTEANDVNQNFYGLVNLRAGINKGIVGINLWANNLFNTDYTAFYFESLGQKLAQKGKPLTFGIDINLSF
ncbi:iron complex outermembrane receptor protein [Dysgonomonadaceae bacterium PH5-43]|nr:iron complex outermembrane receptor protein [Dysgonomonadaceae bacterium PH5-43]